MRIISGTHKGQSIKFVKNVNTRPLKDSVKENIFNILEHSELISLNLENSNVLDLYSGFGSFGIECLSRGANSATFVEQDKNTSEILKGNLLKFKLKNTFCYNEPVELFLKKNSNKKFDIFFLDPPFLDENFIQNINLIKKNKIFNKKNILIVHREKKTNENFSHYFDLLKIKTYGRSKIFFGFFQ